MPQLQCRRDDSKAADNSQPGNERTSLRNTPTQTPHPTLPHSTPPTPPGPQTPEIVRARCAALRHCEPGRTFRKRGGSQSLSSSGRSLRSDSRLAMEAVPLQSVACAAC